MSLVHTYQTQRATVGSPNAYRALTSLFIAALFLLLIGSGISLAQSANQPQMVVVVQSNKPFAETLKAFRDEAIKAGWSVLNSTNMAGILSERGFTLAPVVILDVCSGKYSAQILRNDAYRPISAFMPCRISIYQTTDGKVFVTRMNTAAFTSMMPAEVADVMKSSDAEIAQIIARATR